MKFLVEARRNTFKSPKPDAARLLAFDLLTEVNRNEGYSNLLLPQALNASKLDDRDRSLVTELLYGTIRMQGKHDWVLAQISDRPWSEVDPGIVDICRLGVHQIHEMRIPDHAAVAELLIQEFSGDQPRLLQGPSWRPVALEHHDDRRLSDISSDEEAVSHQGEAPF